MNAIPRLGNEEKAAGWALQEWKGEFGKDRAWGVSLIPGSWCASHLNFLKLSRALRYIKWVCFFLMKVTVLFCFPIEMFPGLVQQKHFYITTVKSWHKAPLCALHYFLTNIVHCHIAEVNLINIGTFNFYVRSKELFHADFEYWKEMIARKIMLLLTIQSN